MDCENGMTLAEQKEAEANGTSNAFADREGSNASSEEIPHYRKRSRRMEYIYITLAVALGAALIAVLVYFSVTNAMREKELEDALRQNSENDRFEDLSSTVTTTTELMPTTTASSDGNSLLRSLRMSPPSTTTSPFDSYDDTLSFLRSLPPLPPSTTTSPSGNDEVPLIMLRSPKPTPASTTAKPTTTPPVPALMMRSLRRILPPGTTTTSATINISTTTKAPLVSVDGGAGQSGNSGADSENTATGGGNAGTDGENTATGGENTVSGDGSSGTATRTGTAEGDVSNNPPIVKSTATTTTTESSDGGTSAKTLVLLSGVNAG